MTNTDTDTTLTRPPMPDITTAVVWHDRPDSQLQGLDHIADSSTVGITLFLPWGIATGTTLSGAEFFSQSATRMRQDNVGSDGAEVFVKGMVDPIVEIYSREPSDEELIHQGYELTRFIHLRDVTCVLGGRAFNQPLLRVQLSHVSAWHYGRAEF